MFLSKDCSLPLRAVRFPANYTLLLALVGDVFQVRCSPCVELRGFGASTVEYVQGNVSLVILNSTAARIMLREQPLFDVVSTESIGITVQACCLGYNKPVSINVTVVPPTTNERLLLSATLLSATRTAGASSAAVGGIAVSPAVASQASRTSMVLDMMLCTPSFDQLDFSQSPTQLSIGNERVAMHVGAAVMNLVLMFGFAMVQVIIASVHALMERETFVEGLTWARFPSLFTFPVMLLLEPTAMSSCVMILYGSHEMQLVGFSTLAICFTMPVIAFLYLSPGLFAAHYLTGERLRGWRWLIMTRSKWRDLHRGFCRRNRLLFCDYRDQCRRFIAFEQAICVVTGILEGSQMGSGRCTPVLAILFSVFIVYLVVMITLRPYVIPAIFALSLVTTMLQCASAGGMLIYSINQSDAALNVTQLASLAAMYVLSLSILVGICPRIRMIVNLFKKKPKVQRRAVRLCNREDVTAQDLIELCRDSECGCPAGSVFADCLPAPPVVILPSRPVVCTPQSDEVNLELLDREARFSEECKPVVFVAPPKEPPAPRIRWIPRVMHTSPGKREIGGEHDSMEVRFLTDLQQDDNTNGRALRTMRDRTYSLILSQPEPRDDGTLLD